MLTFKTSIDRNGNKICRVIPPNHQRGFSIQTNGNMPETDRLGVNGYTLDEVVQHVMQFGTERQRLIVSRNV